MTFFRHRFERGRQDDDRHLSSLSVNCDESQLIFSATAIHWHQKKCHKCDHSSKNQLLLFILLRTTKEFHTCNIPKEE